MKNKCLYSSDITIKVNKREVAFAQQCTLKSFREHKCINAYGESNASSVAVSAKNYEITLVKIQQVNEDIDLALLNRFTVSFNKQGKTYNFKNCEWINLCENVENGKSVVMSATIVSPSLEITEGYDG